eukprot:SAG25_NODE_95_length_15927_cov_8.666224_19_plen_63_part_00
MFLHVCPSRPASVPQAGVRVHSPTSLSEITSPTSHGVLVLLGFGDVEAAPRWFKSQKLAWHP